MNEIAGAHLEAYRGVHCAGDVVQSVEVDYLDITGRGRRYRLAARALGRRAGAVRLWKTFFDIPQQPSADPRQHTVDADARRDVVKGDRKSTRLNSSH